MLSNGLTIWHGVIDGAGGGDPAAPQPNITAPSEGATLFEAEDITLSVDDPGEVDEILWVLNPGPGETILTTDDTDPLNQIWTTTDDPGTHDLVARTVLGASETDSEPVSVTIVNRQLVIDARATDGNHGTTPTAFLGLDLIRSHGYVELYCGAAGGTTNTGAGGGGPFAADHVALAPATAYAVTGLAGGAANTNANDVSFNSGQVLAKGGLSGGNGGTGGQASASVGSIKRDGGNGSIGTGNRAGGGGAGRDTAASGATPGTPDGGFAVSGGTARGIGAGGPSATAAQQAGFHGRSRLQYFIPRTAGFPYLVSWTYGRTVADAGTHAFSVPSESGGRLCLLTGTSDAPTIGIATDWTGLAQRTEATNLVSARAFHFDASGGDPDDLTITTSTNEQVAWLCLRVHDAGVPEWTTTDASSTNADCPEHTSSVGAVNGLWVASMFFDASALVDVTAPPANYSGLIVMPPGTAQGILMATAFRYLNASAENPGAVASASEQWIGATLLFPPA